MAVQELFPSNHKLEPSSVRLKAYGGGCITNCGTCTLFLRHNRQNKEVTFYVIDTGGPAMLGLHVCQVVGLVKINCAVITTSQNHVPKVRTHHMNPLQRTPCWINTKMYSVVLDTFLANHTTYSCSQMQNLQLTPQDQSTFIFKKISNWSWERWRNKRLSLWSHNL